MHCIVTNTSCGEETEINIEKCVQRNVGAQRSSGKEEKNMRNTWLLLPFYFNRDCPECECLITIRNGIPWATAAAPAKFSRARPGNTYDALAYVRGWRQRRSIRVC